MINLTIYGQQIFKSEDTVVSDSVKYLKITFDFSEDWNGTAKTAVFRQPELSDPVSVVLNSESSLFVSDNVYLVPHEVIKAPSFTVSVFGIDGDKRITTPELTVRVKSSGYGSGAAPSDPTPTEYEQLVSLAQQTQQIAQSVRDDADSGEFKGEKGDQGIQGIQGIKGDTGLTGAKGDKGEKGDQGLQGVQGPKGDTGATGQQGQNGLDGYTPVKGTDYFTLEDIEGLNIPTKTSDLQNDSDFLTEHNPVDQTYSATSGNAQSGIAVAEAINGISSIKADAIIRQSVTNKNIEITDSSFNKIVGLNIYGESIQDGNPTPSNPVNIINTVNPTVTIYNGTSETNNDIQTVQIGSNDSLITLRGIKNSQNVYVSDVIEFANGHIKFIKKIGYVTFGKKSWSNYSSSGNISTAIANLSSLSAALGNYNYPTMFEYLKGSTYSQNINTIFLSNKSLISLRLSALDYPNIDSINSFMDGKTMCYVLDNPIETDITDYIDAETLQKLSVLHTNYPITTIMCDAKCSITYKADTKNYIDNKFSALQALILEG